MVWNTTTKRTTLKDKTMEAKQKAIQEAYGEYYEKCNPDENGWCKYVYDKRVEVGVEPFGDYQTKLHTLGSYYWRPLSIQGIESNNGWIKIESEADLPKDDSVNYDMYNKNGRVISDLPLNTIIQLFQNGIITHYSIHIQRKPPIY